LGTPGTRIRYSGYPHGVLRVLIIAAHLLAKYGAALDLAQDVYAGTNSRADELVVADICNNKQPRSAT
jgi:hypothetical protein